MEFEDYHRDRIFLICILLRLFFVYLVNQLDKKSLRVVGIISLLISVGFFNSYLKFKESDRGVFGGLIWWNQLRLVHSILYLIFGVMSIMNHKHKEFVLILDISIGVMYNIVRRY